LETFRRVTAKHGALLIFDEVISGFRLGPGGAAQHYRITPDLACFGKVIGGGMPVGAFAGPRRVMKHLAPEGAVYQAGTLSGNPVAMSAGLATLRALRSGDVWSRLETLGALLEEKLGAAFRETGAAGEPVRLGSLFWMSLQAGPPPRSAEAIDAGAAARYRAIFHHLLGRGVHLAPSAYEVGFLARPHDESHVTRLADALREALAAETRAGEAS
jgi:glutamate-1-semialdehyde 2,1-aminomutase